MFHTFPTPLEGAADGGVRVELPQTLHRDTWGELRKKAHILLVLDVSGSMGQSAGAGKTRLELAEAAAANGLAQLSDTDEVG